MEGSGGRGKALVVRVSLVIVLMRRLLSAGQNHYSVSSLYALYIDRRDLSVNLGFSKLSIVNIINGADKIGIYFYSFGNNYLLTRHVTVACSRII